MIRVDKLRKEFQLGKARMSVAETLGSLLRTRQHEENPVFTALQDISFQLGRGEVLGIIGRNGAGKSTLLKILSRVLEPTEGKITIRGRVASILEIGTGFHPELTGRENIYLSGTLLGQTRAEIDSRIDEITAFSGIGAFIDTPVKRYSSGMFLRLAFSVAAHLEADIILLDEVLAVGDSEFTLKSFAKIRNLIRQGRSVIFVSHDLAGVAALCTHVMILEKGRIAAYGTPSEMIGSYIEETVVRKEQEEQNNRKAEDPAALQAPQGYSVSFRDDASAPGNEWFRVLSLRVTSPSLPQDGRIYLNEAMELDLQFRKMRPLRALPAFHVAYQLTQPVMSLSPWRDRNIQSGYADSPEGVYTAKCRIPEGLTNTGIFSVDVFWVSEEVSIQCHCSRVLSFRIHLKELGEGYRYKGDYPVPLLPNFQWTMDGGSQA